MTQSIFIQVGQCGNQIGHRFWDLALREHAEANKGHRFDESMRTFFDISSMNSRQILKARSLLVDMEEGVVKGILRGPLGNIFDAAHLITDIPGSGNNWAVGYYEHGEKHASEIIEALRRTAESCDCLQCFFILHSMGGGTGSGTGSFVTTLLADYFPEVFKIITAVFPSLNDDVITSPYNTVLALDKVTEFADCVIAIENQALATIANNIRGELKDRKGGNQLSCGSVISGEGGISEGKVKAFDEMNNIVANMLLNLTSSARFQGTMNVDLNELSMNLVPFPRLHYLIAAQSPITSFKSIRAPRNIDQVFQDVYSRDYQLISTNPKAHTFLATSLLLRGDGFASDIRRNIDKLQKKLKFVPWNLEGWKVGHCEVAPVGQKSSLLAMSNNTSITIPFSNVLERFNKLIHKKAHIHHYLTVNDFEMANFEQSATSLSDLIQTYKLFDSESGELGANAIPTIKIAD
ncbi:unnamed protein product [Mesocestoides corti]|uniref:Tubulin/FtsZ GTPase domain-containing protein n=2 Tax=Mesocestoides corti TaxID=53468 RepID=A0A0R3UF33_MESCO|nr:unnamed protein product [Mesocestoides corti]